MQAAPPERPVPVLLTKIYFGLMALVYLAVIALGLFFLLADPSAIPDREMSVDEARIIGVVYTVLGVVLAVVYFAGLFLPRNMVGWIGGIVLLGFTLLSCVCWPIAIPLLVFWCLAPTRAWHGVGNS